MKAKNEEKVICQRFEQSYKELKKQQKISRLAIANQLGTYSHVIGKYMKETLPSMSFLYNYCKLYNVDPAYLFGLTDNVFLETKEQTTIIQSQKTIRQ